MKREPLEAIAGLGAGAGGCELLHGAGARTAPQGKEQEKKGGEDTDMDMDTDFRLAKVSATSNGSLATLQCGCRAAQQAAEGQCSNGSLSSSKRPNHASELRPGHFPKRPLALSVCLTLTLS